MRKIRIVFMVVVELLQIHAAEHHSDTGLIAIYNKSLEQ